MIHYKVIILAVQGMGLHSRVRGGRCTHPFHTLTNASDTNCYLYQPSAAAVHRLPPVQPGKFQAGHIAENYSVDTYGMMNRQHHTCLSEVRHWVL